MTQTQVVVGLQEISVHNERTFELKFKEQMYDFATLKALTLHNKH
jgi:hypothetical protein